MKHLFTILLITITIMVKGQDRIKTDNGFLDIHFIGHGTLYIHYKDIIIHIDPWSNLADYDTIPKADYVLVTHQHRDHLDPVALKKVIQENTIVVCSPVCQETIAPIHKLNVLNNGDALDAQWGTIEAVPAYNIQHLREPGKPFHPKGEGNGYILNIDGATIYIAGDTENIPEMKNLKHIDVAFLPMNLPYTMTPEMVSDAVDLFHPRILYPYHFGETDTNEIVKLLENSKTEVRIRDMK